MAQSKRAAGIVAAAAGIALVIAALIPAGQSLGQPSANPNSNAPSANRGNQPASNTPNFPTLPDTSVCTLNGHAKPVAGVAFSPDARWAMTASYDGTLRIWPLGEALDTNSTPQGAVLAGHTKDVNCVAISPDGQYALSGSDDQTARIWKLDLTGEGKATTTAVLSGHKAAIVCCAFSPNGDWAITGAMDKTAKIWRIEQGKGVEIQTLTGHGGTIWAVGFSDDGQWAATASQDRTVKLWRLELPFGQLRVSEAMTIPASTIGEIRAVGLTPNGMLVTGSTDKTARVFSLRTRVRWVRTEKPNQPPEEKSDVGVAEAPELGSITGHSSAVYTVATSKDSNFALTGGQDKTARLWRLDFSGPGRMLEAQLLGGHTASVISVALSNDGKWALTGSADNSAKLYRLHPILPSQVSAPATLNGHEGPINSVAISADKKWALTGSNDTTARLWALSTDLTGAQSASAVLAGHTAAVTAVALSTDGKLLLTGSSDKTAKVWRVSTNPEMPEPATISTACVATLSGHTDVITSVALSADGGWALTGSADNTAKLWQLKSTGAGMEAVATASLTGHTGAVTSVSFYNDGSLVITGSADRTARAWAVDLATGGARDEGTFVGHFGPVTAGIVLRGDIPAVPGLMMSSGSTDRSVRIWQFQRRVEIENGPDGKPNGGRRTAFVALDSYDMFHGAAVDGVAASQTRPYAATVSENTVRLWKFDTNPKLQATVALDLHHDGAKVVALSNDCSLLLSAGTANDVRVWVLSR